MKSILIRNLFFFIFIIFGTISFAQVSQSLPTDRGRVYVDTVQIPNPAGTGTVDGYTIRTDQGSLLRGVSIGLDGNFEADDKYFKLLHSKGINAVRYIFFDPYGRFSNGDANYIHFDGSQPESVKNYLHRLERLINVASVNGIYVLINFHAVFAYTDCPKTGNCNLSDIPKYLKEYWSVVGEYFKDRKHVFYEILNEPKYMYNWTDQMIQDQKDIYDLVREKAPETHIVLASISGVSESVNGNKEMVNLADQINAKGIDWKNASIGFHPYHTAGSSIAIRKTMAKYPVMDTEQNVASSFLPICIGCDPFGSEQMDGETWGEQTLERLQISWFSWVMDNEVKILNNYQAILNDATAKRYLWKTDSLIPGSPEVFIGKDSTLFLPDQKSIMINAKITDPNNTEIVDYLWEQITPTNRSLLTGTEKGNSINLNNLTTGTYAFVLTVKNKEGFVGSDAITITVTYNNSIPGTVQSEYYSDMSGVLNGGSMVGSQDTGDGLDYQTTVAETGKYLVEARICRGSDGDGNGQFLVDGVPVSPVFVVPFTGADWNAWKTASTSAFLRKGNQTLHLNIIKGAWNSDYYKFTKLALGVSAGADKTAILPNDSSLILPGEANGNGLKFKWIKKSGPDVDMSGDTTQNLSLSKIQEGTYIFGLTATDVNTNTDYDEVKLIAKHGMYVNAGADKTITLPTNHVLLSATLKSMGVTNTFTWEQVSGPSATFENSTLKTTKALNLLEGIYIFKITGKNELGYISSDEIKITVQKITGVEDLDEKSDFKIFPNPATACVTILFPEFADNQLSITDLSGNVIFSTKTSGNSLDLDTSNFTKGIYIVSILNSEKRLNKKLIIQ